VKEHITEEKEKKLLEAIAAKPTTYYDLYHKQKVGSSSFVWKALKQLEDQGLIEVKREENFSKIKDRRKRFWGLTFKGLLACLKHNLIKPANGINVEKVNQIKSPYKPTNTCYNYDAKNKDTRCLYLENFRTQHPEIFYKILSRFDFEKLENEELNALCCTATTLGTAWLYLNDQQFYHTCIQQGLINCGCWGIYCDLAAGDPLPQLRFFEMFLKALKIETKSVADLPDD